MSNVPDPENDLIHGDSFIQYFCREIVQNQGCGSVDLTWTHILSLFIYIIRVCWMRDVQHRLEKYFLNLCVQEKVPSQYSTPPQDPLQEEPSPHCQVPLQYLYINIGSHITYQSISTGEHHHNISFRKSLPVHSRSPLQYIIWEQLPEH